MEERQTLLEQENMKKFLQLLEENGMSDQKHDVEFIANYVDQMESQFTHVIDELKTVRQELTKIQDKTIRATATRAVDKVAHKVEEAKGHLVKLKNHIKQTVDKAVGDFKEHGKSALVTALNSMNVKGILENIKGGLNHATQLADHGIDNLSRLGNEIHAVNSHLKNVGRVIAGKESQALIPRDTEKGMLSKIQESLFFSMKAFTKMSQKTDTALSTVKKIEEKVNDRKSVRTDLQDIKKQQTSKKNENSRKETELGQR